MSQVKQIAALCPTGMARRIQFFTSHPRPSLPKTSKPTGIRNLSSFTFPKHSYGIDCFDEKINVKLAATLCPASTSSVTTWSEHWTSFLKRPAHFHKKKTRIKTQKCYALLLNCSRISNCARENTSIERTIPNNSQSYELNSEVNAWRLFTYSNLSAQLVGSFTGGS